MIAQCVKLYHKFFAKKNDAEIFSRAAKFYRIFIILSNEVKKDPQAIHTSKFYFFDS